jgi:oligopeptide transport system permease protein
MNIYIIEGRKIMITEAKKKLTFKLIYHCLVLISIILIVICITQIPADFNITKIDGRLRSNISFSVIKNNVSNYIKFFLNGGAFKMVLPDRGLKLTQVLRVAFVRTFTLFFYSILLSLLIGVPKGIFDSRRNKKQSTIKLLQTLIPLSFPDVLSVSVVQMVAYTLFVKGFSFPGIGPILYIGHQHWSHAIYPIIALSLVPAAYIARITATSIENSYDKEFVTVAQGKGASEIRIIFVHIMRGTFAEIIAAFPAIVSILFSSLVIVERIFYYPGITYEMIGFYNSASIGGWWAMLAFTTFGVMLAISYYILLLLSNVLKKIVSPKLREQ